MYLEPLQNNCTALHAEDSRGQRAIFEKMTQRGPHIHQKCSLSLLLPFRFSDAKIVWFYLFKVLLELALSELSRLLLIWLLRSCCKYFGMTFAWSHFGTNTVPKRSCDQSSLVTTFQQQQQSYNNNSNNDYCGAKCHSTQIPE